MSLSTAATHDQTVFLGCMTKRQDEKHKMMSIMLIHYYWEGFLLFESILGGLWSLKWGCMGPKRGSRDVSKAKKTQRESLEAMDRQQRLIF